MQELTAVFNLSMYDLSPCTKPNQTAAMSQHSKMFPRGNLGGRKVLTRAWWNKLVTCGLPAAVPEISYPNFNPTISSWPEGRRTSSQRPINHTPPAAVVSYDKVWKTSVQADYYMVAATLSINIPLHQDSTSLPLLATKVDERQGNSCNL